MLEFVATRWPFFNASIVNGNVTHIVPTNAGDGGFGKRALPARTRAEPRFFASSQHCALNRHCCVFSIPLTSAPFPHLSTTTSEVDLLKYMTEESTAQPPGQPWRMALPIYLRQVAFMAHNGLHFGEFRGHHPPGPPSWWTRREGVVQPRWWEAAMFGWFVPGKDLRIPNAGWFSMNQIVKDEVIGKARRRESNGALLNIP